VLAVPTWRANLLVGAVGPRMQLEMMFQNTTQKTMQSTNITLSMTATISISLTSIKVSASQKYHTQQTINTQQSVISQCTTVCKS
jgi:hypothetical protein